MTTFRPHAALVPAPAEVAEWIAGDLLDANGAPERLTGLSTLDEARPNELSFAVGIANMKAVPESEAGVLILTRGCGIDGRARIEVDEVWTAVAEVMGRLYPRPPHETGIHATAHVDSGAVLADNVTVGPFSYVGAGAKLEAGVIIGSHCSIDPGCRIDADTRLYNNIALQGVVHIGSRVIIHSGSVLGSDGFKFEIAGEKIVKIPQVGLVVIEDDVEIGAGCTVDRPFVHETRIGRGTKLDNLVHVGHNVIIGRSCLIAAKTAFGGSAIIEDGCMFGGRCSVRDGITVGRGTLVAGGTGIAKSVGPGSMLMGYPAMPMRTYQRAWATWPKLPEAMRRLKKLETAMARMGVSSGDGEKG